MINIFKLFCLIVYSYYSDESSHSCVVLMGLCLLAKLVLMGLCLLAHTSIV